jgi:NAD(P)-dependent dehydrogenase (short-subunit alcohol dehydrogenase family)
MQVRKRYNFTPVYAFYMIDGEYYACSASKHAVEGFTKSLRQELIPWGIRVCNINPAIMK